MNPINDNSSFSSDDSANSDHGGDNLNKDEQANSANGLDSTEVTGGQNGRNIRGMGSQDMDSENGVLRFNDTDNGAMEVTDEALANAAASQNQTSTATVSVTTSGPDDYASDPKVDVPNAQKEAKKQDENSDDTTADSSEKESADIAETGTSVDHQPTY